MLWMHWVKMRRIVLDDHGRSPRVQEVAGQDRALVAPDDVGRWLAAADCREIDDVVVQQRSGVDQLERGGDLDAPRPGVATKLGRQAQQRRAQSLAAGGEHVVADRADQLGVRIELVVERVLDLTQALGDALEDQRDQIHGALAGGVGSGLGGTVTHGSPA
jgi:hypothetical protein